MNREPAAMSETVKRYSVVLTVPNDSPFRQTGDSCTWSKHAEVVLASDYAKLEAELAQLRVGQGPVIDEQAAFEEWLRRVCPSGDAESVHGQWKDSSDYEDLYTTPQPSAVPDDPVENDAFVPGSLADLLFQLGEKGVGVSGGTHGDRWQVRLPQPSAVVTEVTVPDGCKLVPVELTREMIEAANSARGWVETDSTSRGCYRAMLAAAPSPTTVQGVNAQMLEALEAVETLFAPCATDSTQKEWLDKSRAAIAAARHTK